MLYKQTPNLKNLPEWGTCIFVICKGCSKLDEKAEEGHWVRYSADTQGHRTYWLGKHHVSVEWNVMFDTTVPVKKHSMAKGEQNALGIGQTADNSAPNHTAPPPNVPSPDPL